MSSKKYKIGPPYQCKECLKMVLPEKWELHELTKCQKYFVKETQSNNPRPWYDTLKPTE